jgi:hypothetical protein
MTRRRRCLWAAMDAFSWRLGRSIASMHTVCFFFEFNVSLSIREENVKNAMAMR